MPTTCRPPPEQPLTKPAVQVCSARVAYHAGETGWRREGLPAGSPRLEDEEAGVFPTVGVLGGLPWRW